MTQTTDEQLGDDFGTQPVGTGPFHLRNDDYWQGAPLLDGVRVRIIPEQSVHVAELRAGNIHISCAAEPKDAETLERDGLTVTRHASPGSNFISPNVSKGLMTEFPIRRAVAHAVDRDTIIDRLLGFAEVSRAGVPQPRPTIMRICP